MREGRRSMAELPRKTLGKVGFNFILGSTTEPTS